MTLKLRKKKLHIKIGFSLLISLFSSAVQAQITVNLPAANIISRTEYLSSITLGEFNSAITLLPNIGIRSVNTTFNNIVGGVGPAPLGIANFKISSIAGISVLGTSTERSLSTSSQSLFAAVASLVSGTVLSNLRLTTSSFTWVAGTYSTDIALTAPGLLGGNAMSPPTQSFSIVVPAFITAQNTAGTTSILVNNLSFYRSPTGISGNKVITLAHTVPYIPSLQTGNSNFSFSTNLTYNNLPVTPVSTVNTTLTAVGNATPINLSSTAQTLTNTSGIVVPTSNSGALTHAFSITGAQLKARFVQAGTYSVPLTYIWNKLSSAYPTGGLQSQSVGTLEVVVSELSELIANQQTVSLSFTSANHYKNGMNQDMPAHLKLSKTTPYNLYVRATSATFASGVNSIPLNVMRIGPIPGETGMQTVTLSSTAQQLINAADPTIDRSLSIRYTIPASETSKLLNKPAGTYSTNIIFSLVAP
jgi:hypothetical protein